MSDKLPRQNTGNHPDPLSDPQAARMDSLYLAGVQAGWNAANSEDPNAELARIHAAYSGHAVHFRCARKGGPERPASADDTP